MRLPVLCPLLLSIACNASSPDGGGSSDVGPDAQPGAVALEVTPVVSPTIYSSVPVRGRGPGNGTLVYDVPGRGQSSANIGASGTFCVDVPLEKDSANELRFQAIDADGAYSEPVTFSTTQSGSPPKPEEPEPSDALRNIALGSDTITTDTDIEAGTTDLLVDGKTTDVVELSDSVIDDGSNFLTVKLTERARIYGVKVTTAEDCPLEEFDWYLSNADAPPAGPLWYPMGTAFSQVHPDWTWQNFISESKTVHTLSPAVLEPQAKWLSIDFESYDCGPWPLYGTHRLAEIEVTTRDGTDAAPPPQNPTPTCASGGGAGDSE